MLENCENFFGDAPCIQIPQLSCLWNLLNPIVNSIKNRLTVADCIATLQKLPACCTDVINSPCYTIDHLKSWEFFVHMLDTVVHISCVQHIIKFYHLHTFKNDIIVVDKLSRTLLTYCKNKFINARYLTL